MTDTQVAWSGPALGLRGDGTAKNAAAPAGRGSPIKRPGDVDGEQWAIEHPPTTRLGWPPGFPLKCRPLDPRSGPPFTASLINHGTIPHDPYRQAFRGREGRDCAGG